MGLLFHKMERTCDYGGNTMAYKYSKGWFLKELKEAGITKHPIERKKLELYKTYIIRNLYNEVMEKKK